MSEANDESKNERILWAEFLEQIPPTTRCEIQNLFDFSGSNRYLVTPDIQLHCNSDICNGIRFFSYSGNRILFDEAGKAVFLEYSCRNCRQTPKMFAVYVVQDDQYSLHGVAMKFGELPVFGPPTPARVITLIGPDRELFIRGRRSENHGLGIGAFAYYRRVVENQKGRLISEIVRVAKRINAPSSTIELLEKAITETQFNKAVEDVKGAIPEVLLIGGHNPLTLLHHALSQGLHAQTDEECLELATSIRVVLTELAERISQALKDEAELKQAVGRLMRPSDKRPQTDI